MHRSRAGSRPSVEHAPTGAGPTLEILIRRGVSDTASAPVVLVHGGWHGAWCWDDGFAERLASHGHDVFAPSLRGHGGSGSRWRLSGARIRDYVADLDRVIAGLGRPAILVGHSMGAFVVQKYLERQAAAGAVLLAPMPHFGVAPFMLRLVRMAPWATLRMHLSLGALSIAATPDIAQRLFFSSDMPEAALRRHQRRMQGEACFACYDMLGLDLCRPSPGRTPMLVLGAAEDRVFTRAEVEAVARAHGADLEFVPGMAHDMMLEAGWADVADRIATWIEGLSARGHPASEDDRTGALACRHDP